MSLLESLDAHMDSFDHGFLDLNPMEQTVVDDIMSEMTVGMTIEEEIIQLQEDGLLDLNDHSGLPCKLGIEATDMGSLLEQFEEASQTLGDCDLLVPSLNIDSTPSSPVVPSYEEVKDANENIEKKEPQLTPEMIQRIRSLRKQKQKSAVLLPLNVPAKRGRGRAMTRGHPVALPASCTPLRLQRVIKQDQGLIDSLPLAKESDLKKGSKVKKKEETVDVDENYFELIVDHDYPRNVANPKICDISNSDNEVNVDIEEGEVVDEEERDQVVDKCRNVPDKSKNDKHYSKRGESPEFDHDSSLYFDKLPSYYTALSIPTKRIKKTASCVTKRGGRGGISVHDYIERDGSPVHDTSTYSKLPDYYSSFTNSTKYDSLSDTRGKDIDESKDSGYSSLSHTPRPSKSRSRSCSPSQYVSVSRSRSPHSHSSKIRNSSYSPYSSRSRSCSRSSCSCSDSNSCSSSRSCSTCSSGSQSRSRSRSAERSWKRERSIRGERSHKRNRFASAPRTSLRTKSPKCHSSGRRRSKENSYSRSKSRDCSMSRYRSRSRSHSRGRSNRSDRSVGRFKESRKSIERRREQRRVEKEEEKQRQMKERRIVYVGGIPESFTRNELKKCFSRFGEIEHVQLHFREHGDNYGFVTFVYTCDAYAAIEKGKKIPSLEKFDLCFGGRRQFCDVEYADLDGNKEVEEEYDPKPRRQGSSLDFDELLRQARQGLKKS